VDDTLTSPPLGASIWEHELFSFLTEHTRREGAMLQEYVGVAEQTESKALAYVINLLLEDERRHHRFFDELAASLKSEAELSGVEPVIPRLDLRLVPRTEMLEISNRLLESEKSDALELKRLRKDLKDVEDTTLWGLLVGIMSRDTEKHMAILRFVADHARPRRSTT
jgi:hypothetical protein